MAGRLLLGRKWSEEISSAKIQKKQDDSKENRVGFGVWFKSLVSGKESGKK